MTKTTAKDIAAALSLSPSAVSLALNGKPGVSEDTRARVLEAAMQMGYTRSSVSAPQALNRTICFVRYTGSIVRIAEHTSFSSFVLQGVEARAAELGYSTHVRYLNIGDIDQSRAYETLRQADGIIILGTDITKAQLPEIERFLSTLDRCPVVVVDSILLADRVDCVINDCYGGAKAAVEHLLKSGHRHIGYVRANQRIPSLAERERGVRAALQASDIASLVTIGVDVSSEGAFQDLDCWIQTQQILPDGIFADNDILAAAVIRALKKNGLRVPRDISVIGFDDIPTCELLDPPLSTVHAYKEELGAVAVDFLQRRILRGEIPHQMRDVAVLSTTLSTHFVPRLSVRSR